ncbi:MAG TPA: hypothetical protein VG711_10695 [Phycisphaerales bacterium]|nr:hypothetical protein [Phycisphaerales bacterium]
MPDAHTAAPSLVESQQALMEARRKFGRVIASWASDALEMRRRRLNIVQWQASIQATQTKAA